MRAQVERERRWERCVCSGEREDKVEGSGGGGMEGSSRCDEPVDALPVLLESNSLSKANISDYRVNVIAQPVGIYLIGPVLRLDLCAARRHEDEVLLADPELGGNPSFQLWQSVHVSDTRAGRATS